MNHHLHAKDFDDLWAMTQPGATLVYWTSRSLAVDCSDAAPGFAKAKQPEPTLDQDRARALRAWAQRKARSGDGYLTQARRGDGAFDYRITRAVRATPHRTWAEEQVA